MRLREYLEVKDGLKSKLREAAVVTNDICDNCGEYYGYDGLETLYGDTLCEDCWEDYINSERGLVEYAYGLAAGDLAASDFETDLVDRIIKAWIEHKAETILTATEIADIENELIALGFVL